MATVTDLTDRMICHCLQIRESDVRAAVECGAVQSIRDVMNATTAGTGCTACHCAIRQILEERALAAQR
jgi:bacterioferritin-associated ferredoxin